MLGLINIRPHKVMRWIGSLCIYFLPLGKSGGFPVACQGAWGAHGAAQSANIILLYSIGGRLGILNQMNRIHYLPAETQHAVQNRPWVPHAGGQDDGS